MKIILPLVAVAILFAPFFAIVGCAYYPAKPTGWQNWRNVPPDGPDAPRKADKDGNPNFGPK